MIRLALKDGVEKYESEEVVLQKNQEMRILHSFLKNVYIRLLEGSAEIFGAEMVFNYYLLPSDVKSISVYSTQGCRIEIYYEPEIKNQLRFYVHTDEDNYYSQVLALNAILEAHRVHSLSNFLAGPKVLIIGSQNSGKFSLIRNLINYAVKNEWKPILADMDPIENKLSGFGTISASVFSDFVPFSFNETSKLAFFFGYDSLKDRFDFYTKQLRILATQIQQKIHSQISNFKVSLLRGLFLNQEHQEEYISQLKKHSLQQNESIWNKEVDEQSRTIFEIIRNVEKADANESKKWSGSKLLNEYIEKEISFSGVFFNLPNEICNFKPNEVKELIEIIEPDYVVVISNDYLKSQIEKNYKDKPITLIRFPRCTGVSSLETTERKDLSASHVQGYFNSEQLMCIRDVVLTNDITIYQIESASNLPLKYITSVSEKNLILTKIDLSISNVKGKFLGLINLLASEKIQIEDIMNAELIALIYVIDSDGKTISLKRPQGIMENYSKYVLCCGNLSA